MRLKAYNQDDKSMFVLVDTNKAIERWDERCDFDGHNMVSRATGSAWDHETLYCSSRGKYYVVEESQWQGTLPSARLVSPREAAAWLELMEIELPEELRQFSEVE